LHVFIGEKKKDLEGAGWIVLSSSFSNTESSLQHQLAELVD